MRARIVLTPILICLLLCSAIGLAADNKPGAPAQGRIDILLFSDFECPFCAAAANQLRELEAANGGRVRMHFKHAPLEFHQRAPLAHKAAIAAAEQGKFREMHDAIFRNQSKLDRDHLVAVAKELALDVAKFEEALDSSRVSDALERDQTEAVALGIGGRPTMFINGEHIVGAVGREALQKVIDVASGLAPPDSPPSTLAGPPSLDGAPIRGALTAPVTITVFSDFECPFSGRFNETLEALRQQSPGQFRIAFKHFPLSSHASAPLAHKAALAAGEQGKFWVMHDRLFRQQRALAKDDLLRLAEELGLDMERFRSDLESDRIQAAIAADLEQGRRHGVTATPTFFVNGRPYSGAIPIDELRLLASKGNEP